MTPDEAAASIPASLAAWIGKGRPVMLDKDDEDRPCVRTWPEAKELWTLPVSDEVEAFSILNDVLMPLGYFRFVVSNQMRCEICGEFIESTYRHDYRKCACGNIGVDGGHDYARQTRRTERFSDYTVFGWAAEGDVRAIVDALEAEGPRTSFQARMIAGKPMRTYEVAGRERRFEKEVVAYSEGRTKYEAVRPVVAAHPGMCVESITDRSLPFDQQILLKKLGLGEESREGIIIEALDDWEGEVVNLLETAENEGEARILKVHMAQRSAELASARIKELSR